MDGKELRELLDVLGVDEDELKEATLRMTKAMPYEVRYKEGRDVAINAMMDTTCKFIADYECTLENLQDITLLTKEDSEKIMDEILCTLRSYTNIVSKTIKENPDMTTEQITDVVLAECNKQGLDLGRRN